MTVPVASHQRFTARQPCVVCGGHARLPSGQGRRCYGYLSDDGRYAHCTRGEYAGVLDMEPNSATFAHRLGAPCRCGQTHGDAPMASNGHHAESPPPRVVKERRWPIATVDGDLIEHVRLDLDSGEKRLHWERAGVKGLGGIKAGDLPVYGRGGIGDAAGVIVCEGELARDSLDPVAREIGLAVVATVTGAGGTKRPSDDVLRALPDVPIYIWGDADRPGAEHRDALGAALLRLGYDARTLDWPAARPDSGDDAVDWLVAGGTPETLAQLVANAAPFVSDAPSHGVPSERKLAFRSALEIATTTTTTPPWIAAPWLVAGAITELDGRIKASGKTTFATHLCRAILDGRLFMGEPTSRSPIVYLTEQTAATFREALRRADLLDRDDFRILFWHDTIGVSWPDIVRAARDEAARIDARTVIVDTLSQFAGISGDGENDAGHALAAMHPLQEAAAADGLAVMTLRHERKGGGGDVADSGRGSSAFAGAVDIVLRLRRAEGASRPTLRVLESLSRFDETPDSLVIELTDSAYTAHGDSEAVAADEARAAVLTVAPTREATAMTEADLLDAAGDTVKRTLGRVAIREHLDAGRLCRTGAGKRGDPFKYWRPGAEEKVSDGTTFLSTSERNETPAAMSDMVSDGTQGVVSESFAHGHGGVGDDQWTR